MYKEAYTMIKQADAWDDFKNTVSKGWKQFNDYADKNQWVRPATYGIGGLVLGGAFGGAPGAGLGAGLGAITGFGHNYMSAHSPTAGSGDKSSRLGTGLFWGSGLTAGGYGTYKGTKFLMKDWQAFKAANPLATKKDWVKDLQRRGYTKGLQGWNWSKGKAGSGWNWTKNKFGNGWGWLKLKLLSRGRAK